MKQFARVNARYGAPMGRASFGYPGECPARSVRLFRVYLDQGGYDDGGAYWGHGEPIWCARSDHYQNTCRAPTRLAAMIELGLTREQLVSVQDIPS